tara:strand:- start:1019 stop:1276 length:258 start_codon:yes stop_codon:yes gene_type:complete
MQGPYYLVIAGSLPEAKEWAFKNGLPPVPSRKNGWSYVVSVNNLRGTMGTVVFVPGYQRRTELEPIIDMAFELIANGRLKEWNGG